GVKVILMRQELPGAMLPPQVPPEGTVESTAKSPVGVMLETVSVPVPELVSVKANGTEVVLKVCWPKSWLAGVRLAMGVVETPVPDSATVCGEPVALSVMVSVAVRAPAASGVKVGKIPQEAPEFNVAGQLLVCAKSPALAPVKVMLLM